MRFLIARAEAGDIEFIKRLEISSGLSSWSGKDYIEEIGRKDSVFLVVKCDGEPCGFLLARLIMINKNPSQFIAEIYNIAVEKKFRRHKIGSELLNSLITAGKRESLIAIQLEVRKSNIEAIKFYEKHNLIKNGTRKNFYSNPTEDAIIMSRTL